MVEWWQGFLYSTSLGRYLPSNPGSQVVYRGLNLAHSIMARKEKATKAAVSGAILHRPQKLATFFLFSCNFQIASFNFQWANSKDSLKRVMQTSLALELKLRTLRTRPFRMCFCQIQFKAIYHQRFSMSFNIFIIINLSSLKKKLVEVAKKSLFFF